MIFFVNMFTPFLPLLGYTVWVIQFRAEDYPRRMRIFGTEEVKRVEAGEMESGITAWLVWEK